MFPYENQNVKTLLSKNPSVACYLMQTLSRIFNAIGNFLILLELNTISKNLMFGLHWDENLRKQFDN